MGYRTIWLCSPTLLEMTKLCFCLLAHCLARLHTCQGRGCGQMSAGTMASRRTRLCPQEGNLIVNVLCGLLILRFGATATSFGDGAVYSAQGAFHGKPRSAVCCWFFFRMPLSWCKRLHAIDRNSGLDRRALEGACISCHKQFQESVALFPGEIAWTTANF